MRTLFDNLARARAVALAALIAVALTVLPACAGNEIQDSVQEPSAQQAKAAFDLEQIPSYTGVPYTEVDGNAPTLTEADAAGLTEDYAPLDDLGRCGTAIAVVSPVTMPAADQERGDISDIHPTGWVQAEYAIVPGGSLYNRCHLIGWQLTAEDANERNLVTGTRYLNTEGMLPFENEVADYVRHTGGRVLYRVTPVFVGDELVCRGVHMEALSLGDGGAGVCFNVFCYNVQPSIEVDYATGKSREMKALPAGEAEERTYVLNGNTKRFHAPDCPSVRRMKPENRDEVVTTRDDLMTRGYEPCGSCSP